MIFLSEKEVKEWKGFGQAVLNETSLSKEDLNKIRPELIPYFHYFIGTLLASKGKIEAGKKWLKKGSKNETIPGNSYMLDYIERHENRLALPQVTFSDPRPFVHFSNVPEIKRARENFINSCSTSLPKFDRPIKIMDIGCGSGMLLVQLLQTLSDRGKIQGVSEILLIDTSEKMLELAKQNLEKAFPNSKIIAQHKSLQEISCNIESHYDVAMSALAWHHMPFETKLVQAKNISKCADHFLLFELEANHDIPEQYSPELAVSMYQTYGNSTALVLAHDAPKEVAMMSVDYFLMSEAISLLTQSREKRTDHHMPRRKWHDLFMDGLGNDFSCLCDSTCYSDLRTEFYALHYGLKK